MKKEKTFQQMEENDQSLDFGGALGKLIHERSKDVPVLAKAAGISRAELYNILKNRPKYSLIYKLRALARELGITLTELVARAEGKTAGHCLVGDDKTEYNIESKKHGFSIIADTPLAANIFSGRIILAPGSESIGGAVNLFKGCHTVHLRLISGRVIVVFEGREIALEVNEKITFNPRLPYRIKNGSRAARATLALVASPGLESGVGTEGDSFHDV